MLYSPPQEKEEVDNGKEKTLPIRKRKLKDNDDDDVDVDGDDDDKEEEEEDNATQSKFPRRTEYEYLPPQPPPLLPLFNQSHHAFYVNQNTVALRNYRIDKIKILCGKLYKTVNAIQAKYNTQIIIPFECYIKVNYPIYIIGYDSCKVKQCVDEVSNIIYYG